MIYKDFCMIEIPDSQQTCVTEDAAQSLCCACAASLLGLHEFTRPLPDVLHFYWLHEENS